MTTAQGTEGVVTEPVVTEPVVTPDSTGTNPNYQHILDAIPESLHSTLLPELKKWDENFTREVGKAKEQVAPYKDLIDKGYDAETATQGIQLLQAIEADPANVIKVLQEAYNLTPAEAKQVVQAVTDAGTPAEVDPIQAELNLIKEQQKQLAQYLTTQQQTTQQQQNQVALQNYLAGLKKDYPLVPEDYIIPNLANGIDGEVAAKKFMELVEAAAKGVTAPSDNSPTILGSGGGLPSNQQDVSKLSDKDTNNLVARMLEEAAKQT